MTEAVMGALLIGGIGLVFVIMGYLIGIKEKISLLHNYHYKNVSGEDKTAFCRLSGMGIALIGVGLLVTAVIIGVTDSAWSFLAFAAGFAAGLVLLIYAGARYDHE